VSTIPSDISIDELLAGLGLTGEEAGEARRVLEAEGVTNPRKKRVATSKTELARQVIDRHWQRLCHNCRRNARVDDRAIVAVAPAACFSCGGSNNARAVREMVTVCRRAGIVHLVIVGGSPNTRRELAELTGPDLELRLVDGTANANRQTAQHDIAWSDLIVVLGSTQLAHRVSTLYTRDPEARKKLIVTSRRGIEAIADEIARSVVVNGVRR
jgi:hypothetical protein